MTSKANPENFDDGMTRVSETPIIYVWDTKRDKEQAIKLSNYIRKEIIEEIEKLMKIIETKNRFESFIRKWMLLEGELNKLKEKQ